MWGFYKIKAVKNNPKQRVWQVASNHPARDAVPMNYQASLKIPKTRLAQFFAPEFTVVNEEVKMEHSAVFGFPEVPYQASLKIPKTRLAQFFAPEFTVVNEEAKNWA